MTSGQVGLNDWTYYPSSRDNAFIPYEYQVLQGKLPIVFLLVVLLLVLMVICKLCRSKSCRGLLASNSNDITYQREVERETVVEIIPSISSQVPSAIIEPVAHLRFPSVPQVPVPAGWSDPTAPPPPFEHPPTYTEAILKSHYGPIVNFPEKFH